MRRSLPLVLVLAGFLCAVQAAAERLTEAQRLELIRALSAEYAKAKVELPRSRAALALDTKGVWDKPAWAEAGRKYGPAARVGDLVQITKVDIQDDNIVFEINGGFNAGKAKWYQHITVGMGQASTPVSQPNQTNAPAGTSIVLKFHQPVPPLPPDKIKKMLAAVLDFDRRSVAQTYVESLPPEMQKAVKEKRVIVGMDRDEVLAAVGKPVRKVRNIGSEEETEDWIYGTPPGKMSFVTFKDGKVIKVRDDYAGLGTEAPDLPTPQ
jgi:hypothetical protein